MNDWILLVYELKLARQQQGLTQRGLAAMMGVSQPEISMWETGVHAPTLRSLCDWANALGVRVTIDWRAY